VHKGVTQNFLELFRAHYNLRTRRWGRHKGTSAHECLTSTPVTDWLSLLGSRTDTLLDTVKGLLDNRYRASSAIEGFNAALRPYLYVHKGVTQNFLELFRAHYNLRTRRWGRHKGTSEYRSHKPPQPHKPAPFQPRLAPVTGSPQR